MGDDNLAQKVTGKLKHFQSTLLMETVLKISHCLLTKVAGYCICIFTTSESLQ